MKQKAIQIIPLFAVVLSYTLNKFGLLCMYSNSTCSTAPMFHQIFLPIIQPIYIFFYLCLFTFPAIFLLFVSEKVFSSWWRIARWFLLASFLILLILPEHSGGYWASLDPFVRYKGAWVLGTLFTILSTIVVIWKFFAERKRAEHKKITT